MNAEYRLYLKESITLIRGMVIKSHHSIEQVNEYLTYMGYLVLDDPRTWKTYLNLAGLYHESDSEIKVVSSDSHLEITLSPEVLKDHPITRSEYGPRGIYHKELLKRYPDQVNLIPRIFYPVEMETAISSPDHTIMTYDKTLVGEGEDNLISGLQEWLYSFLQRWVVSAYSVSHPLYAASYLAVMYQTLALEVISIRLRNCHTSSVGSFHLWNYLSSNMGLSRYREHLTHKQALFLYRNIRYIKHNVGKDSTMLLLQKNITEPARIKAFRYEITQTEEHLIRDRVCSPAFIPTGYANARTEIRKDHREDTEHVYGDMTGLALWNDLERDEDTATMRRTISATTVDAVPTGLVELKQEYAPNEDIANVDFLTLQTWFYAASVDYFPTIMTLRQPGQVDVTLSSKDAAVLLMYALNLADGGSPDDLIPRVQIYGVTPVEPVPINLLYASVSKKYRDTGAVDYLYSLLPKMVPIRTTGELATYANACSIAYYKMYTYMVGTVTARFRGETKKVMQSLFTTMSVALGPEDMSYGTWAKSLNLTGIESSDPGDLVGTVLEAITGSSYLSGNTDARFNAMTDILRTLTSYGCMYVKGKKKRAGPRNSDIGTYPAGVSTEADGEAVVLTGAMGRAVSQELFSNVDRGTVITSIAVETYGSNELVPMAMSRPTSSIYQTGISVLHSGSAVGGRTETILL